jgi:hypothetical protein
MRELGLLPTERFDMLQHDATATERSVSVCRLLSSMTQRSTYVYHILSMLQALVYRIQAYIEYKHTS